MSSSKGYGTYNFIKHFKVSGVPRACILNKNGRKKRREHHSRKLEKKIEGKKKDLDFPKPKNIEYLVRCSVR